MGLIVNEALIFADTFSNIEGGPGLELRDMDAALTRAVNDHISQPSGGRAFVSSGFGDTWNSAYTVSGLPTTVLRSHGTWIDPLIRPILATATATHLTSVALLMNTVAPPVAQAAVALVQASLARATGTALAGAPAIISALIAAQSAAATPPGLLALPAAVSAALAGLAGLVLSDVASPVPYAEMVNSLDFQLQTVGLVGAVNLRAASWSAVSSLILAIPPNPELRGPLGVNFWQSILVTVIQAVPGIRAI